MRSGPKKRVLTPRTGEKQPASSSQSVRHVSMLQLSELLGRERNTIRSWVEKGCPIVQRAAPDNGMEWIFDVAEVVRWRERQVIADSAKLDGNANADSFPAGYPFPAIVDAAKRITAAMKLQDSLERAEAVAPIGFQVAVIGRAFALGSSAIMSLPDLIAREMVGFPRDKVLLWREMARDKCRGCLDLVSETIERDLIGEA